MRFRLRTLLIALALLPPVLAGVYWLAVNSKDFWEFVGVAFLSLAIGLVLSLPILWYRQSIRAHFARARERGAWKGIAVPWWFFAGGALFFTAAAWLCASDARYTFATGFAAMALMELAVMSWTIWKRLA